MPSLPKILTYTLSFLLRPILEFYFCLANRFNANWESINGSNDATVNTEKQYNWVLLQKYDCQINSANSNLCNVLVSLINKSQCCLLLSSFVHNISKVKYCILGKTSS